MSWQQTVAVLLILAILIFCILAFGSDIERPVRNTGHYGLAICVSLLAAVVWSQWRASRRQDIYPDIVGGMADPSNIFQVGPVHILITPLFVEHRAKRMLVAQNTRDGPATLTLRFSSRAWAPAIESLSFDLPGATVAVALADLPLEQIPERQIVWDLTGSARASGRQVRFRRYQALTRGTGPFVAAVALLGGHLVWGGGTSYRVAVPKAIAVMPLRAELPRSWIVRLLWSPDEPLNTEETAHVIENVVLEHDELPGPSPLPEYPA